MPQRNQVVDLVKFVAALFVIGIHTRPFSGWNGLVDFCLCDIIFRTAVPFFAVCTGFYLSKKTKSYDVSSLRRIVQKTLCKVLLMYVGWSFFYLMILFYGWKKEGLSIMDQLVGWTKSFLVGNSYYHLWYLAQLFGALFVFYPIVRFVQVRHRIVLTMVLWLVGIFTYVYSDVFGGVGTEFVNYYNSLGSISGAFFRMLPLLLTGSFVFENKGSVRAYGIGSLIMLVLLCFEVFVLKSCGVDHYSYVIFTLPLAYCLFSWIERLEDRFSFKRINTKTLASISTSMYLLHPAIIVLFRAFSLENPLFLYLMVSIITIFLCYIFHRFINSSVRLKAC